MDEKNSEYGHFSRSDFPNFCAVILSLISEYYKIIGKYMIFVVTKKISSILTSLKACNFIIKRLQHRCFPVKFEKFLRTPFVTKHLR